MKLAEASSDLICNASAPAMIKLGGTPQARLRMLHQLGHEPLVDLPERLLPQLNILRQGDVYNVRACLPSFVEGKTDDIYTVIGDLGYMFAPKGTGPDADPIVLRYGALSLLPNIDQINRTVTHYEPEDDWLTGNAVVATVHEAMREMLDCGLASGMEWALGAVAIPAQLRSDISAA